MSNRELGPLFDEMLDLKPKMSSKPSQKEQRLEQKKHKSYDPERLKKIIMALVGGFLFILCVAKR